jgi:prepilin-type N-terminal cleavage/methylation domain-containing protein
VTRRGFTMIELLVVLTILGILANLALPVVGQAKRKAQAVQVLADLHAVTVAAHDQFADNGTYPANGQWGEVPVEFEAALPNGFQFSRDGIDYRWRLFGLANGLPKNKKQTQILGLSVRAKKDKALIAAVQGLYHGEMTSISATSITFVIE